MITLKCVNCGKKFSVYPYQIKNGAKYCSIECKRAVKGRLWSKNEISLLRSLYPSEGSKKLALVLNRTEEAIRLKAKKLRLAFFPIKPFNLNLTDREIGYIAGVLDGEGHLTLKEPKNHRNGRNIQPLLIIANTDMNLLLKCQKILKGGTIDTVHLANNAHNSKQCFQLRIMNIPHILAILEKILPELTVKKEQAKLIMWFCKNRAFKPAKSPYTREEREVVERIHIFNKRGIR
jgi:hypothetical protein